MQHLLSCIFISLFVFSAVQAQETTESNKPTTPQKAGEEKRINEKTSRYENRLILDIDFRGNTNFSSEKLRESMEFQGIGESYNVEKLQADLDRMRVLLYADNGYLLARFQEPEFEDTSNGLKIIIPVNEGLCYRAGKIKVKAAKLLSSNEALQMIGLKTGDIVRGFSVVQRGIERLVNYYKEHGYIQFSTDFVPEFREAIAGTNDATVDLTFVFDEGEAYSIGRIEFTGNTTVNDGFLIAKLAIREGDLYKLSLIEKSIYNLNDLGIFEMIRDEDFEIQFNETTKQVNIIIHLKEK